MDALSRLLLEDRSKADDETEILEEANVFTVTVVEMADTFKDRIRSAYNKDPHWNKILKTLHAICDTDRKETRRDAQQIRH